MKSHDFKNNDIESHRWRVVNIDDKSLNPEKIDIEPHQISTVDSPVTVLALSWSTTTAASKVTRETGSL